MSARVVAEPVLRPATGSDVPALEAVMLANEELPAGEPPVEPGIFRAYLAHLVGRPGGRVSVAVAGGSVIGFGAAVATGRSIHLADLFLVPAWHGRGVGGRLLAEVMADGWPRTTFSSSDPRAVPLYVRAGMRALWPSFYLAGDPARLPPAPAGLAVAPATFESMADLERDWTGVDRRPDLAYWPRVTAAEAFVVTTDDGRPVATGFGRPRMTGHGRWLDHAAVAPDVDPVGPLLAALRFALAGAQVAGTCVPGPSPLLRPLLEAGFRVRDQDTFLASDPGLIDPERTIPNPGIL